MESEKQSLESYNPRIGNVDDLPPELIEQLTSVRPVARTGKVLQIVASIGLATVDDILVGLWRKHGEMFGSRQEAQSTIIRMCGTDDEPGPLMRAKRPGKVKVYRLNTQYFIDQREARR